MSGWEPYALEDVPLMDGENEDHLVTAHLGRLRATIAEMEHLNAVLQALGYLEDAANLIRPGKHIPKLAALLTRKP